MKLSEFIENALLPDDLTLDKVALVSPENPKEKIYITSLFSSDTGFFYRKTKEKKDNQIFPMSYKGDIMNLEVSKDAFIELNLN